MCLITFSLDAVVLVSISSFLFYKQRKRSRLDTSKAGSVKDCHHVCTSSSEMVCRILTVLLNMLNSPEGCCHSPLLCMNCFSPAHTDAWVGGTSLLQVKSNSLSAADTGPDPRAAVDTFMSPSANTSQIRTPDQKSAALAHPSRYQLNDHPDMPISCTEGRCDQSRDQCQIQGMGSGIRYQCFRKLRKRDAFVSKFQSCCQCTPHRHDPPLCCAVLECIP